MVNRNMLIGIGVLIIVVLGFLVFLNMTGKITAEYGAHNKVVKNEYFKISNFGDNINNKEDFNETQNNG